MTRLQAISLTNILVISARKNINGKLNFILLDEIGNAVVSTEVSAEDIAESLSVVA